MILERHSKHKKTIGIVFALVLAAGAAYLAYSMAGSSREGVTQVDSFEACVAAGYPILDSEPPQCETPDGRRFTAPEEAGPSAGWQQATDDGVTFSYPAELPTTYITAVDWPPAAQVLSGESFSCIEAGSETERAGRTEQVTVDGRVYCRTTILEGAAGSVYGQYAYAFRREGDTVILTFTTRSVQCDNYDEPARTTCRNERESFDLDALVDQIAETVSVR